MSLLNTYTDEEKFLLSKHRLASESHSQISDVFVLGYRCNEALTEHSRLLQLENEQLAKDKEELVETLQGMLAVVGESTGVTCYHLNGDIADWDEFEEVANLYAVMEKHKCD